MKKQPFYKDQCQFYVKVGDNLSSEWIHQHNARISYTFLKEQGNAISIISLLNVKNVPLHHHLTRSATNFYANSNALCNCNQPLLAAYSQ